MRVLLGFLADDGRETVETIWSTLSQQNLSGDIKHQTVNPHISMAIVHKEHQQTLQDHLENLVHDMKPIPVNMPFYGVFTAPRQVIFLGVTITDALYSTHRMLYQEYSQYLQNDGLMIPAHWIPHCTLALDIPETDVSSALDVCRQFPLPINTIIDRLAIVDNQTLETTWSVEISH